MMSIRTSRPKRTVSLQEGFAGWSGRVKAKAILSSQEIAKVEAVHGLSNLLELLIGSHRG